MAHLSKIFKNQPVDIPNRSGFDISFENVLSMTTGTLIPVLIEEVLPNETYSLGYMAQVQLPPMATEFFGRVDMRLEAFFVPNRILWAGWQDFMTMPVFSPFANQVFRPQFLPSVIRSYSSAGFSSMVTNYGYNIITEYESQSPLFCAGSLADYLGIKTSQDSENINTENFVEFPNILPFLAYHKIYDDWYRNPNIIKPLFTRPANDGGQAGFSMSTLPYISFKVNDAPKNVVGFTGPHYVEKDQSGKVIYYQMSMSNSLFFSGATQTNPPTQVPCLFDLHQRCWEKDYYTTAAFYPQSATNPASISIPDGASNLTIPQIRSANVLQRWLERNNIAGMRYSDQIKATWGIMPSDALLDRPLFLGSSKFGIYTKGVAETAYNTANETYSRNPFNGSVGTRAGSTHGFGKDGLIDSFTSTEHGFIMVIASVVPHAYYSTGIRRYLSRSQIGDFANPLLQGLGEQAIYSAELIQDPQNTITNANSSTNNPMSIFGTDIFGYQQQYSEYKYHDDEVHGRLQITEDLSAFCLQRYFSSVQLDKDFVSIAVDELDDVLASDYTLGAVTWADFYFDFKKVSPLSEYVIPTLGDLKNTHKENIPYRGRQL